MIKKRLFIAFTLLVLLFQKPIYGVDQQEQNLNDPAFFRMITQEGLPIYILGCYHPVPLESILSGVTLNEIKNIWEQKPIFYTEHEIDNTVAFQYLQREENLIDKAFFDQGYTTFKFLGIELTEEEILLIKDIPIFLNLKKTSEIRIKDLLQANPWLSAVILGTHSGILNYKEFGWMEYDLETKAPWAAGWSERLYLETTEQSLALLKLYERDTIDDANNQVWAKRGITNIILSLRNQWEFVKNNKERHRQFIKQYSWNDIAENGKDLPKSALERNKLWVQTILTKLKEQNNKPLFIAVGNGHCAGFKEKVSFIHLLMENLNLKKLERFTNKNKWIEVKIN